MRIPIKQRLKLVRQKIYAAMKFRGHVPLSLRDHMLGAVISVEGRDIFAPSPLRWKLYKKGWRARLNQLEAEYGVGRHVTLGQDSIVLDIGANAGEFAHVCARYGARVFCLEPDPKVFACLQANIADLSNALAHETLIWKNNGDVDFYSAPDRADSSVFAVETGPAIRKHAETIEAFCQENAIARIDLLKCDAEGAEPEGIGGMFPHMRAIALDTGAERQGKRTNKACAAILKEHDFKVIDEKIGKRLLEHDADNSASL